MKQVYGSDSLARRENADDWDYAAHGGMGPSELRSYADSLDKSIRMLDLDQVYQTVQNGTHVLFYGAVFCPYTQQFTAIWYNMQLYYDANSLQDTLGIAKVQCADNLPKCFHYMRDEGFPTIVLYHNGRYVLEVYDRNNVWDFVWDTANVLRSGAWDDRYKETGSMLEDVKAHEFDVISHEKLEEEVIGGKEGIFETVLPVTVVSLVVGIAILVGFAYRYSFKRRGYAAVAGKGGEGETGK